ncbi:MAG: ATP-binding protein [Pseudomonadota bacterium]
MIQDPSANAKTPTGDLLLDTIGALPDGIALFDADHCLVACNPKFRAQFPNLADRLQPGARWIDLLKDVEAGGHYSPPVTAANQNTHTSRQGGLTDQLDFDRKAELRFADGAICDITLKPMMHGGFVAICSDVTDQRQAESTAREQENILRTALDASPAAIVMARLRDGKILYRSPGAAAFFGDTETALEHYADPGDRDRYTAVLAEKGRVDDYRIMLRDSEGTPHSVTSWGRLVEFDGDAYAVTAIMGLSEQQLREAMIEQIVESCPTAIQMTHAETGDVLFYSPECVALFGPLENAKQYYVDPVVRARNLANLRQKGSVVEQKVQFYDASGTPFWGAVSARLVRYKGEDVIVSHTRDLTEERKLEAEMAHQQDQLHQNEKLLAMGELLAGVAHELNNPLSVVVGHSLMLREDCKEPDVLRQVEKISHAAERCAKIVKTFLTMARQHPTKLQNVDVNELVQTAVDVARYGESAGAVDISCALEDELPEISADPDQITQVILNLILNAEQAIQLTGTGGQVRVETCRHKDGAELLIRIADDGPGIPEEIRSRIFEPFFTTKDVGHGTGIGLTLCHRIIKTHEGDIRVSPGQAGGTVFEVTLPAGQSDVSQPKAHDTDLAISNKVKILIVDDETDVAELNAEILTRGGYDVDVFDDADAALAHLREHDVALILSDLNMPGIDGRGFFETITAEFPHMIDRTGFITGDTMGRSSQTFLDEADRPFLEKPVAPKELRAFVGEILEKAEATE